MPDLNRSTVSSPVSGRRQGPVRLISIITTASSCVLFACAGCCYLVSMLFRPTVIDSPAGATEICEKITDWSLPTGFTGKSGLSADNMILRFDVARFVHHQGRGNLIVAQLKSKSALFAVSIKELAEQNAPEIKKINVDEHQARTLTVRNLPAEFQIEKGEDRASTTKYCQVIGQFRGKQDDAILILQFEQDQLTDEQVDAFLKSIH
jgi:hypothetical protein